MITENKIRLYVCIIIWIENKNNTKKNEMKRTIVCRSLKEICQANSQYSITQKNKSDNNKLQQKKGLSNKYRKLQLQKYYSMDGHKENQDFAYSTSNRKDVFNNGDSFENRMDKETYLNIYHCDNKISSLNRSDHNNSNIKDYENINIIQGEEIEREDALNFVGEEDSKIEAEEDLCNSEVRTIVVADDLLIDYTQNKCITNNGSVEERLKDDNITTLKIKTVPQSLSATAEAQPVAIVENTTQHQNHKRLVKDLNEQILHGQQINVHTLLDVASSICSGPIGALCDMAAFSKLDYSTLGDFKDQTNNNQNLLAKKYYHPLYAHGVCRWPGCELPLDDMATFVKHLKTEHCLDDRSTAQARVQMQVVSQLEMHLQKERDRLQAMMHHLYLTKHFVMPEEDNFSHVRYKNSLRSVSSAPDLNKTNNSGNDDSDGTNELQSLLINSGSMNSTRKRICDKSPLALAGGLPYMLERAGLDVQQEIQRNREFYKNADVRPPFTYASLIRQSIIESPDKQLTLNEIYNWFQNTFCYFRRNAATWKNAIRTNLSLHKCFVRYEDDFGSFWMVDDSEFVKRRHLSRGRPREYGPSSSPNSNSQQFGNTIGSTASSDVVDGESVVSDAIASMSPDSSIVGTSSRQRYPSSGNNLHHRSSNKINGSEKNGGNDDYDVCEVSQRSPAGCQTHVDSGRKQHCGYKQRLQLQSSIIGVPIKTNVNSLVDRTRLSGTTNIGGDVVVTENEPGVGGIDGIGPIRSLDVDNHNVCINIANTDVEREDPIGYDIPLQSISNDAILNSPTGSKSNSGRYSPNLQNIWSFGSSLTDEITSAEFACINNDRYRNFVTGLHLQSLTQRHHFHQHKSTSHRMYTKTTQHQQQQNNLRNNISSQQHDVRSLHQPHDYNYHTNHDEQQQKIFFDHHKQSNSRDSFGVNAFLSNTDKYFTHNIECRNDDETFKHEPFNQLQQQNLGIRHHPKHSRSDLSTDEITNHLYIHHHNGHEIDVKYSPLQKYLYNFDTASLNLNDVNANNKRPADYICSNKTADTTNEDSGIVDCVREEVQRKRKKNSMPSTDYDQVEIKAEADSESGLRNINVPLRTKSY